MPSQDIERKLTAILSADVKGYSRLMGEDEESTIRTLNAYREIMSALIQQHRGRVVDATGDNLLAEFSSVVNAVECAVDLQQELKTRNAELPENRRMEFRIGVNLGDVIEEGERIYGDGVNIAARLENVAEGGGICISGSAYEQIENKLALGYEYLGEQTVKNIKKPVPVYRVLMAPEAAGSLVYRKRKDDPRHKRRATLTLAAVLVVGVAIVAFWKFYLRPSPPSDRVVPDETPTLELPDKPSIAVLPFTNMSGDAEQEYFSDGLTEDLITDLSKISGLFVISRNSVFFYKGRAVNPRQVSEELGVRYVLEGSVRKAGDRVRITAQLIDATTGGHVWAERYDRELEDVFTLQDEITQQIVVVLKVKMDEAEQQRVMRKDTASLTAYDYVLRGRSLMSRYAREENAQAQRMYERAIDLEPEYATAYANLGWAYFLEWIMQWSQNPQSLERASELAKKAIALNDSLSLAHRLLGHVYLYRMQFEQAVAEKERAITLDPNDADGYAQLGEVLVWAGRPEEGIVLIKKAMRLNPHFPIHYLLALGSAYSFMQRYEEAIATHQRALSRNPDFLASHIALAFIYSISGREEEARAHVAEVLRISPNYSLEVASQSIPFRDRSELEGFFEALRRAGLE